MKKTDLIIGKWYGIISYEDHYFKFGGFERDNQLKMLEYRHNYDFRNYLSIATNPDFWNKAFEATYEKLKSFLPLNHPDLIQNKTYELW